MVCKLYCDFNEGYKSGSYYILGVEPISDYNVITAFYGLREPRAGAYFDARTVAQTNLDGTIFNAIRTSQNTKRRWRSSTKPDRGRERLHAEALQAVQSSTNRTPEDP